MALFPSETEEFVPFLVLYTRKGTRSLNRSIIHESIRGIRSFRIPSRKLNLFPESESGDSKKPIFDSNSGQSVIPSVNLYAKNDIRTLPASTANDTKPIWLATPERHTYIISEIAFYNRTRLCSFSSFSTSVNPVSIPVPGFFCFGGSFQKIYFFFYETLSDGLR